MPDPTEIKNNLAKDEAKLFAVTEKVKRLEKELNLANFERRNTEVRIREAKEYLETLGK